MGARAGLRRGFGVDGAPAAWNRSGIVYARLPHFSGAGALRPVAVFVLLLAACGLAGCGLPFTRLQPTKTVLPEGEIAVPIHVSEDHDVEIDVGVNESTCRLILDTGAQIFLLSPSVAERLGVRSHVRYPAQLRGASGNSWEFFRIAELSRVRLGKAIFHELDCMLHELPDAEEGYLNFGMFRDCLLTLDFPRGEMRLRRGRLPPANGRDILSYTLAEDTPRLAIRVGGNQLTATIDTGYNGFLAIPESLEGRFAFREPANVYVEVQTINSRGTERYGRIAGELRFGRYIARDPPVLVGGQSILIGMRLLKEFRITFDQEQRLVRFERD